MIRSTSFLSIVLPPLFFFRARQKSNSEPHSCQISTLPISYSSSIFFLWLTSSHNNRLVLYFCYTHNMHTHAHVHMRVHTHMHVHTLLLLIAYIFLLQPTCFSRTHWALLCAMAHGIHDYLGMVSVSHKGKSLSFLLYFPNDHFIL